MKNSLIDLKDRLVNNYKKNKWFLFVFVVVWIIVCFFTMNSYKDSLGKESIGNSNNDKIIELNKDTKIVTVIPAEDQAESISILFGTYARKNSGLVNVTVKGYESKTEYINKDINIASIQDNAFYTIGFNQVLKIENDTKIEVLLTSNSELDKAVGVYLSQDKYFDNSKVTINNRIDFGDLCIKFLLHNDVLEKICYQIIAWSIVGLSLLILLLLLVSPKYEVLFACVVLVFGLISSIMITPMSAPDEQLHYEYCFQLSNYMMGNSENHLLIDETYAKDSHFVGHYNTSAAYIRLDKEFDQPLELKGKYKVSNDDIDGLYVAYYVPQALGITISRLLNFNMLKLFYFGRLINLLFYVVCIYYSIKNTPKHKLLFGLLATMPMFIQQASSYSYDSFVFGLCFLELSYLLKWMHTDKKIEKKDFIITLIICLLLAPAKIVYGFFSLLFYFVPEERFGNKKNKIKCLLLLIAPAALVVLYNVWIRIEYIFILFFRNIFQTVHAETTDENYIFTVRIWNLPYVFEHPMETIEIILRTIRYQIKHWFYDSISHTLSGHTLVLPLYITYIHIALLLASSFKDEGTKYQPMFKLSVFAVCVIIGFLTLFGMLTGWTERGAFMINGVQGRYFCPLLPFFFVILNNDKIKISADIDKYVVFVQILLYFEVLINVLSYTFVN